MYGVGRGEGPVICVTPTEDGARFCLRWLFVHIYWVLHRLAGVALILQLLGVCVFAQTGESRRLDNLKAVFLYNFIQYVEWSVADSMAPFVIEVLGDSGIRVPLQNVAKMRAVGRRKLIITGQDALPEPLGTCQIRFLSASMVDHLPEIYEQTGNTGVLTIGDTPGFAQKGVAINFVVISGKLKFEVNLKALQHAGLQASSHLLKLGIVVE